jgi:hypothetical protein
VDRAHYAQRTFWDPLPFILLSDRSLVDLNSSLEDLRPIANAWTGIEIEVGLGLLVREEEAQAAVGDGDYEMQFLVIRRVLFFLGFLLIINFCCYLIIIERLELPIAIFR